MKYTDLLLTVDTYVLMPTDRLGVLWDPTVNEALRDTVGPAIVLFEHLTHLGDGAFLLVLGVIIYWFGARDTRRDRAFVIAVGVTALALSAGMKGIVQLPRPDLAFAIENYPGYTFPSAHAMGSAAFYGALSVTMTRLRPIWRYCAAALLVGLISLSRVVIGLHYVGDVVVGAVLGGLLVWIGVQFRDEGTFEPGVMFILATLIAGIAALLGSQVFLTLTIGASLGGVLGWYYVRDRPTTSLGAAVLVLGSGALVGIAGLRIVSAWVGVTALLNTYSPVIFLVEVIGYAALTAFVLLVPWLAIRIEDRPVVQYLQTTLPFRGTVIESTSFPDDDV